MYRVIIEKSAAKEVGRLFNPVLTAVVEAVERLGVQPRPRGVKKLSGAVGWRIRVGEYRILYTIDDAQKIVAVYRVKHRRDVYR